MSQGWNRTKVEGQRRRMDLSHVLEVDVVLLVGVERRECERHRGLLPL